MRHLAAVVTAVLGAAALASCSQISNPFARSPLDEALSMVPAEDTLLGMSFVDFRGIREVTGVDVVPSGTRPEPDATDAQRWGIAFVLRSSPMTPDGTPLVDSTNVDWLIHGAQSSVVKALKDVVSAAQSKHAEPGEVRFDGDLILIERGEEQGRTGRQVTGKSMADLTEVKALRPCLDGAQVASMAGAVLDQKYPFLTASRVDDQGRGHAWACVLAGSDAEAHADSIRRQNKPEVGAVSVKGDVVQVEMNLTDSGGAVPEAALYGQRAVIAMSPGF